MSQSTSGALEHGGAGEQHNGRRGCSWGRSRWSGWEIGAIVLGFVIFWPVGLIALFWKLAKGELWPGSADGGAPWANWRGFDTSKWRWRDDFHFRGHSGNSAFEAYKARELEKLEQLRRKLAEDQKAFGEFLNRLKRAKDQEEFDRFMAERNQGVGQ
jgi:hypothetical protein